MTRAARSEPSVGELVSHLTDEARTLVRDELRLAQAELARKVKADLRLLKR